MDSKNKDISAANSDNDKQQQQQQQQRQQQQQHTSIVQRPHLCGDDCPLDLPRGAVEASSQHGGTGKGGGALARPSTRRRDGSVRLNQPHILGDAQAIVPSHDKRARVIGRVSTQHGHFLCQVLHTHNTQHNKRTLTQVTTKPTQARLQ
jgi:hypothetical protein